MGDTARAQGPANGAGGRLAWTRSLAYFSLLLERLWPTVLALGALASVFLILAWFGVFVLIAGWLRIGLLAIFAVAAAVILWRLRRVRLPTREEVVARIEAASLLEHQPLAVQSQRPLGDDPFAVALWREHQRRMAERLRQLRGGAPRGRIERFDPLALRSLLAMLLVTSFAYSFGPSGGRIADALAPLETTLVAEIRVDAWVTPPGYTGRAPIFLTDPGFAGGPVEVPVGSVVSVRLSDRSGTELSFAPAGGEPALPIPPLDEGQEGSEPAGADAEPAAEAPTAGQYDWSLDRSGTVLVETAFRSLGEWPFVVVPDLVPTISFSQDPTEARNGTLELAYVVTDDYGAPQGQALIETREELPPGARALVPPPDINLAMPRRTRGEAQGRTTTNLVDSPYAGSKVALTLTARDDAGQVGRSEPVELVLPERRFFNPLARAVVEQRRILALDAHSAPRVLEMLDALTFRGDEFIPQAAHYLALRAARSRIAGAYDDAGLLSAVDFLWEIALGIEDGNMSLAERRLREAQEALAEGLREGASDEEIAALMQELREAMQEFMTAMAEAMRNMPPQNQMQMGNMQEIRPQDLNRMLDQIEDLARSGSREAAQDLLAQLQDMMNNLQAMQQQGQQGQQQSGQQNPMQQQMDQLGELLQRQQELMDQTFELGREQLRRQLQEEGAPSAEGESAPRSEQELQQMMEQLQAEQGALQEQLQALQEAMEGMGMDPSEGLGEAGEAMGRAEGALGEGDDGEAVGQQAQALDALRRGAQDMMQQMQAMQEGQGGQPGQGQMGQGFGPGQQRSGRDPLGRQRQTQGPDFGQDVEVPDQIDIQRARQILDQIRNRLGDRLSPQLEREYLERLLQTN